MQRRRPVPDNSSTSIPNGNSHTYVSKIDFVTAAIRQLIAEGEFKPGDQLKQRDLAARLGVSVTPIREALRRVESEGLVEFYAHTGVTVVRVESGPTLENLEIRAALEPLAARLATPHMDEAAIRELRDLNEEMRACGAKDLDRLSKLNRKFHLRIYERASSPLLYPFLIRLWQSFGDARLQHDPEESLLQHDLIIAALASGDAEAAGETTRAHILTSLRHASSDNS